MKSAWIFLGIVPVVMLILLVTGGLGMMGFGGFGMGPGMMGTYGGYGGYGMMHGYGVGPLAAILTLVVWALIISGVVVLVVGLVRNVSQSGLHGGSITSPFDIVKTRHDANKRDSGA